MKYIYLLVFLIYFSCIKCHEDDFEDGVTIEEEITPENPQYKSPTISNQNAVYLAEHFDDVNNYHKKWVHSKAKKDNIPDEISKYDGEWKLESAQKDPLPGDLGLVLKSKAKHAAISAKLDKPFVFKTSPLIVQYEVMFQDGQECGGAYLKLLSETGVDLKLFHDKSPYTIMFGPDKCGNDHKLHFIFRHRNPLNGSFEEKHCKKPKERLDDVFKDKMPHLYTLVLQPDNSFEVWVDKKIVNSGNLLEDFTPAVNPEREIDDPLDTKPVDWDEREKIPDPQAVKPEDWDENEPATMQDPDAVKPDGWLDDEEPMIADPEAKRPDDWDTDMDGEWEAPLIDNPVCATAVGCGKWEPPTINNPAFKGKWRAPLIDNPNYKGKWRPRRIPNPDFFEDTQPFKMQTIGAIGFELWSMSSEILFDNLIITDDVLVANQWSSDTFELKRKKIERDAESVIQRILMYADEYPLLWILYVIGVGFPIVLIVYCCCKTSDKEPENKAEDERETYDSARAATIKKTDEFTKDDHQEQEKSDDEANLIEEEDEVDAEAEAGAEAEAVAEGEVVDDEQETEVVEGPSSSGDVPRKRKVRKE